MRKTDDETIIRMLKEGKQQKEIAEHFGVSPAAICKRVKRICLPESLSKLTKKEQNFALQVARGATKTNAALDAYDAKSADSARALGNKLVKKPSVNAAIADLMDWHGLTRSYRVERLKNHVDAADPNISLKALDQTWKLDGSYQEKPEQTINVRQKINVLQIEAAALEKERAELKAQLSGLKGDVVDAEVEEIK
jgi:phage terminase small subunit